MKIIHCSTLKTLVQVRVSIYNLTKYNVQISIHVGNNLENTAFIKFPKRKVLDKALFYNIFDIFITLSGIEIKELAYKLW